MSKVLETGAIMAKADLVQAIAMKIAAMTDAQFEDFQKKIMVREQTK